jgi:hypothetical protein
LIAMQDKQDNAEEQLKAKIKEHYDELSPYYHDLWGRYEPAVKEWPFHNFMCGQRHIHHGVIDCSI